MLIKTAAEYAARKGQIIGVTMCCLNLLYQRWFNICIMLTIKSIFYKTEIKISIENCKFHKISLHKIIMSNAN